ncbi:MAG: exodeoxyribonuclease VII small subunit [Clostridiales bacterium]|nr:exodeoxyribonuclease VII small subunit [Clostridiales bacterium]MDY4060651.1 exodeoxyribonuclease VII small subunit [Anaerovoracaceae bacterium]
MDRASFEDNLNKLNEMSEKIRTANIPLEESLSCYKEGMNSYRICMQILNDAKLEIEKVIDEEEGNEEF